jgi:hypothetical protein
MKEGQRRDSDIPGSEQQLCQMIRNKTPSLRIDNRTNHRDTSIMATGRPIALTTATPHGLQLQCISPERNQTNCLLSSSKNETRRDKNNRNMGDKRMTYILMRIHSDTSRPVVLPPTMAEAQAWAHRSVVRPPSPLLCVGFLRYGPRFGHHGTFVEDD